MVWNTETEYLVKQLVTSDRSLLVCWSGSFCWSGDIWFHPEVPTDDSDMLYFLGRDTDMWHTCGDTVSPLSVWSFCFFVSWLMISPHFAAWFPLIRNFFRAMTFAEAFTLKGEDLAQTLMKLGWWDDPFFGRMQQKLVGKPESSDSGILRRELPFSVIMARLEGLRTCGDSCLRLPKNTGSLNLNRTCWARWQWKTPRHGAMSELRIAEWLKSFLPIHPMAALCIPQLFKHPWQELSTTCVHQMLGLPW